VTVILLFDNILLCCCDVRQQSIMVFRHLATKITDRIPEVVHRKVESTIQGEHHFAAAVCLAIEVPLSSILERTDPSKK
jgi:hypothetical protein